MAKDAIALNKLKQQYKNEKVFILPSSVLQNVNSKFTKLKHDNSIWTKYDNLGKYIYRYDAELEPSFQQVVPYFLISNVNESKYFVAKNTRDNSYRLGFGEPIKEHNGTHELILKALCNSMLEILDVDALTRAQLLGTIKNLSIDDNKFGLVFGFKAEENNVFIKENDCENIWMTQEELFEHYSKFDNWSKYIIDFLYTQTGKK